MTKAYLQIKYQTRLVADGDSLTVNPGADNVIGWPSVFVSTYAKKSISLLNHAISGDKLVLNTIPQWGTTTKGDNQLVSNWPNVYVVWGGTNDIQFAIASFPGDFTSQSNYITGTVLPQFSNFLDARRAAGWKVVIFTLTDLSSIPGIGSQANALRPIFDNAIKTWTGLHCDYIVDLASNSFIGLDNASSNNPSYFLSDNLPHLSQAGQNLVAQLFSNAMNGFI